MKFRIFNFFLALILHGTCVKAANKAETAFANASQGEATFAIEQPDSMFIPYGSYPHKRGLQLFDKDAANELLSSHNGILGKIKRMTGMSYPVYIGHPDLPGSGDTDKKAYGWIETIAVENEGMRLGLKWSESGRQLVENGHFKYYSPYWFMKAANGGFRPKALISVGLTNNPNIPVPALANEAEEDEPEAGDEATLKVEVDPEIRKLLGLPDDATSEQALEAITKLKETATAKEEEAKTAGDGKATAEQEAEDAKKAANDIREAIAKDAVGRAVTAGKILKADAESKITEITGIAAANDFAAAVHGLGDLPAKVKTESVTGDLGGAKVKVVTAANDESAARREQRAVAVANELERINPQLKEGERKKIAHQRAAHKNPELFRNSPGSAA